MRTLSLYRHAKSAWHIPGLDDFNRPLAERGEKAAPLMGLYMVKEKLEPELVLCSTAVRARQTLELTASEWKTSPEVRFEDALYHAGPQELLILVRALPDTCAHAMLIGHNPGLQIFCTILCSGGEAPGLRQSAIKFPTAALAVIGIEGQWESTTENCANLRLFLTPKDIAHDRTGPV